MINSFDDMHPMAFLPDIQMVLTTLYVNKYSSIFRVLMISIRAISCGFRTRFNGLPRFPLFPQRIRRVAVVIPLGILTKRRHLVYCQESNMLGSDVVGSRLIYYHDTLEKARMKERNVVVSVCLRIIRAIKILLRLLQLLIMYSPLLIVYPLVRRHEARRRRWYSWALYVVERSGPAIIKFAQWASTRRDIFSREFCDLFSRLHKSVMPHEWKWTEKALETTLGLNWRDYFLEFEEQCCGSGCVAQVYKARLNYAAVQIAPNEIRKSFETHEKPCVDVAIKVVHPNVRTAMANDLAILSGFATILHWMVPTARYVDPRKCVEEFRAALCRQLSVALSIRKRCDSGCSWILLLIRVPPVPIGAILLLEQMNNSDTFDVVRDKLIMGYGAIQHAARHIDMRYEGDALRIFAHQFHNDSNVRFPKPLLQTEDILIETFEEGEHISGYLTSPDTDMKKKLASMGMDALLKMVFVNNFVHGDLHPGNILVQEYEWTKPRGGILRKLEDGMKRLVKGDSVNLAYADDFVVEHGLRLVFLDAGISFRLGDRDLNNLRAVFKAVANGDGAKAGELILENAPQERCSDRVAFKKDVDALVLKARSATVSLGTMDVSNLLSDLMSTVSRHRVNLEPNFTCVVLAVMVLEGLGRSLYPQLDLLQEARPVLLRF